jgi:hypothetical protein
MARYQVVSAFCLGGGRDVYVGEEIDLDEYAGRAKVAQGFVVRVPEAVEPPASAADPAVEPAADQPASDAPRGDPAEAQNQDPEPTRRGRRG